MAQNGIREQEQNLTDRDMKIVVIAKLEQGTKSLLNQRGLEKLIIMSNWAVGAKKVSISAPGALLPSLMGNESVQSQIKQLCTFSSTEIQESETDTSMFRPILNQHHLEKISALLDQFGTG